MAFCTVADLADFLQITIAADSAPALRAITEASAAIRNHCRQTIEQVEADTHTFDVDAGRTKLFLPQLPVTAVASVVEDGTALVAGVDYKLGLHGILHRIGRTWQSGVQIVTVTYTHGYPSGHADLETAKSVCTRAAARAYQSGLRAAALSGVAGVQAQSLGDYQVQYGAETAGSDGSLGASAAPILLPSERAELARAYRILGG
jgi:hypothetical protein